MLKLKYMLSNPISTTFCFIRDSRYKCTFKNCLDQKIYYEKTSVILTTQKSEFQCKDNSVYRLLWQTKVKNWSHSFWEYKKLIKTRWKFALYNELYAPFIAFYCHVYYYRISVKKTRLWMFYFMCYDSHMQKCVLLCVPNISDQICINALLTLFPPKFQLVEMAISSEDWSIVVSTVPPRNNK